MDPRPTLLFIHGWGFDASVWDRLRAELADWPQAVAQRAYFAQPIQPVLDGPVVVIGHSYGFMRALSRPVPGRVALISINGFPRFSAAPDFEHGVEQRVLDRMLRRLQAQPAAVVDEFRARCGARAAIEPAQLECLSQDLRALRDDDQRTALRACNLPLLVLAGDSDPIVPAAMTRAAFPGLDVRWREGGGHLLPVFDARWCAIQARGFLNIPACGYRATV